MPKAALLALLLSMVPAAASADVSVQVFEADPPSPATLGHWEQHYVRIGYATDRPIRIRADAFFNGERVPSTNSGSPLYPPGAGEALFWFTYTEPAKVDQVVVRAEEEGTGRSLAEAQLPVQLSWTGIKSPAARARPEWVQRMKAQHDQRVKEAFEARSNRPTPWWEHALWLAIAWSVPLYFILQFLALRRWRGGWRIAAAIPAVPMAFIVLYTLFAFIAGSNLFPLFLIFAAPPALLYLLVLYGVRRLRRPPEPAEG